MDERQKVYEIMIRNKAFPESDTSTIEAEKDRIVYDLYALTEEEIKIVEKQKRQTKCHILNKENK